MTDTDIKNALYQLLIEKQLSTAGYNHHLYIPLQKPAAIDLQILTHYLQIVNGTAKIRHIATGIIANYDLQHPNSINNLITHIQQLLQ
jgi:hypothetical protein